MPEFQDEFYLSLWTEKVKMEIKSEAKGSISLLDSNKLQKDCSKAEYILEVDWKIFDSRIEINTKEVEKYWFYYVCVLE